MKLTAAGRGICKKYTSVCIWRFHNFVPLKTTKPSASLIFNAKIGKKQNYQFLLNFHVILMHNKNRKYRMVSSETVLFSSNEAQNLVSIPSLCFSSHTRNEAVFTVNEKRLFTNVILDSVNNSFILPPFE